VRRVPGLTMPLRVVCAGAKAARCSCYDRAMLDNDATAPEVLERFVELGEYILFEHEKQRPPSKRSQRRVERLLEEQSSLERRLKRLD